MDSFHNANFGRQHGRGRAVNGDWEDNEDEESVHDTIEEDKGEENTDDSVEDGDDESMPDLWPGPDRDWYDNSQPGYAFSGRGRRLDDTNEQDDATTTANEEDTLTL
ncbi:hypothetical protein diail_10544, partial [Diaporthe ilicicola]